MPLLDHFHPPLSTRRHWHAFHHAWAVAISASLNEHLPPGYFAEPNVQYGVEIDVATFDETPAIHTLAAVPAGPALAAVPTWQPPRPAQTVAFTVVTDTVEVLLYREAPSPILVGAVELVSPANKDRPAQRDIFVAKTVAYLHQGCGLVLVDVVTVCGANLHNELLARVAPADAPPSQAALYASAYRPVERQGAPNLEIWLDSLVLGQQLPKMPLWLPGDVVAPVDLEATYTRVCREQRINPADFVAP